MTKVLLITCRADIGGGPEHILHLLRNAPKAVQYHLATPSDQPYFERYATELAHGHIVAIPHRRFTLRALSAVIKHIRRHDIDLVHSHGFGAGLYGRIGALISGRRVVHSFHGFDSQSAMKRVIERCLAWRTAGLIAVSDSEAQALFDQKICSPQKLHIVTNGVEITKPTQRPDREHLQILWLGRLVDQKNPQMIIEIAKRLKLNGIKAEIHVVGDGPLRSSLPAHEGVIFHGATREPRRWMRHADVMLNSSRFEGMALSLLESMSEGLPIVATDVMGNRDVVIDGETGFLFDDSTQAVDAIARLLDKSLRGEFGARAFAHCQKHYDAKRNAKEIAALYHDTRQMARICDVQPS